MVLADDTVLIVKGRSELELDLERWRCSFETTQLRISRTKTKFACVNEKEGGQPIKLLGVDMNEIDEFKYLGSTVQRMVNATEKSGG